jgi:hypothetical protein
MLLAMSTGRSIRAGGKYAYCTGGSQIRLPDRRTRKERDQFAAVRSVFWMISTRVRWRASWDSQRTRSALLRVGGRIRP